MCNTMTTKKNIHPFTSLLSQTTTPIFFDGAMGTELIARNALVDNAPPELLNCTNPTVLKNIYLDYLAAGSQVISTNTFGANRYKLSHYGMPNRVQELCHAGVRIAREAIAESKKSKRDVLVAASVGPIGQLIKPLGALSFDDAYALFRETMDALATAQPDLILIETMLDIQEARAALLAAKSVTDIPVLVTMTFEHGERTTTGTPPEVAAVVFGDMGAAAVGANCSTGPAELISVAQRMRAVTNLPILIQANAGTPIKKGNITRFPLCPDDFAHAAQKLVDAGATLIGGCCGTTPQHIAALHSACAATNVQSKKFDEQKVSYLASRTKLVTLDHTPLVVGERINPNAQKAIAQSIRNNDMSVCIREAEAQVAAGADILDVNVSVPNIDEPNTMAAAVEEISSLVDVPLCIDSPSLEALENGLKTFSGKALVNSTNGEHERLHAVLPLVKKYGASVVGLAMDETGIPETIEGRVAIAEKIITTCDTYGIARNDIFIDALTLAISTEPESAHKTLEAIRIIKQKFGVRTILGVSNVSFGLPERPFVNAAFLAMAVAAGLDAAIINPLNEHIRKTWHASLLLRGCDGAAQKYLAVCMATPSEKTSSVATPVMTLGDAIIKGNKTQIVDLVKTMCEHKTPIEIVNDVIIPSLDEVGKRYAAGTFFLPQLLFAAEAAQRATTYLENVMSDAKEQSQPKATIVFATVKGDLHDIGKNIVIAVLKNYGYKIIDLGKNVARDVIIDAVEKHKADVVALSALMTTTLGEMELIVEELNQKKMHPQCKVIIGGAVVTEEYARSIGADGYARDAMHTVELLRKLEITNL